MEARAISEHELVKICMAELCKKAGFADCGNLVQRDLEFLCEKIESATGVLISLSTIKRLLNEQFSRQPQIATLNAVSMFLGYQHWQDFKLNKNNEPVHPVSNATTKEGTINATVLQPKRFSLNRLLLSAAILIFAAIGLFALLRFRKHGTGNFEKAQFAITKTSRNDLPNTVVFNYNIDEVMADSFFIQQSWDKNRRVKIDKHSHTLTDIYYEPGYHIAKLIANNEVIKTLDVSIPTDRWFFYSKEKIPRSIPKYISSTGIKDGRMLLSQEELVNSQVDIKKENEYLQVYFPAVIEYSSDNFSLHFRIRVHQLNNAFCPYFMAEIFCQKNFMYFTSTLKGCASEIRAQFGENYMSGKTNDLSTLGAEVKEWQDVVVTVTNRKVNIRINNTEVLSADYLQPSGLITGLGFISNGLCEVDSVHLQTLDGKDIYTNDFDN